MALTKARNTIERNREPYGLGVKTATTIFQGGLTVIDAGYAAPGRAATGLIAVGRAAETVVNSGASGAKKIRVEPGVFRWLNSGSSDAIAVADIGQVCYIVDDQTVALTSGSSTRSIAGLIMDVDASGVWVFSGLESDISSALAAEIAAREAGDLDDTNTGANVATLLDNAVIGGIPVVFIVDVPDGATGDVDVVSTDKVEVIEVVVVKKAAAGGASDTITVKNGATAITNAMDINIADKAIVRAGSIDDAASAIAAGGTLRVTRTKIAAANVACRVEIFAVRRA